MNGRLITVPRKSAAAPAQIPAVPELVARAPASSAAAEFLSAEAERPRPEEAARASREASAFAHDFRRIAVLRPQAKLTVSQPGDPEEQEAEQAADDVLRRDESVSREGAPEEAAETAAPRKMMRVPDPSVPPPDLTGPSGLPTGPTGPGDGGAGSATNLSVNPTTRAVSAPNLSQLWDVMTRSGTRESASVQPKFQPAPQYEYDGNNRVTKVVVTVVENKEMPQWTEAPQQCPPIRAEWDRFIGVLDTHENNHVAIDRKHFTNLHARLIGKEQTAAWKIVDDEITAADQENSAYDTKSANGVNEGANINSAVQCAPEKVKSTSAGGPGDDTPSPNPDPGAAPALPPTAQAKLTVGRAGDPQEQEADRMAERVMRMAGPSVVQRRCAGPGACDCPDCRKKQEEQAARQVMRHGSQDADGLGDVSSVVSQGLAGGGQPLDGASRAFLEPRFGHDFSRVRVHTDARAALSAEAVRARAYTVGSDIAFAPGQYAPGSRDGQRLLAHELTHTIQQGASPSTTVQRDDDPNTNSDANQRKLIEKCLPPNKPDPSAIHDISPFRFTLASEPERFTLLDILLNHNSWVGPLDASCIEAIWNSFGKNLAPLLDDPANLKIWNASNAHTLVNLYRIPELIALKEQFKADVLATTRGYLSQNRDWANSEIKRLGLDNLNAPATADQLKERQEMQECAKRLQPTLDQKAKLEDIILGYHLNASRTPLAHGEAVRFGESVDQAPTMAEQAPGAPTWQQVKDQHTPLVALIRGATTRYPTLYALIKDQKVVDFEKGGDDTQLRQMMSDSMHNVLKNIDKTEKELGDPSSTLPLELHPVHEQLYKEKPPWNKPFAQSVAQKSVEQYKDDKFWEDLGLGTLGAALFIFATVATSGAAIVLVAAGAGISAAQATESWLKFEQMNAASQTNLSDKTALLSQADVSAQLMDAVLATVAAFLDAYAAAKELQAAVAGGDEAAKLAAEAKAKDAQGRLTEAETKETQALEAEAARNEVKEGEEIKFRDSKGESHEFVLEDDGVGMCSKHCGLFRKKVEERLNKLSGSPAAGKDILANAGRIDKDAVLLQPILDAAEKKYLTAAEEAGKLGTPEAKRAALEAKKEWKIQQQKWESLADEERRVEAALGQLEQEEAMNEKLGAEGFTQHWGETDMEKQKGLGITKEKGPDGKSVFKDASGNVLASGETADFVGKSADGRYKIAESKGAEVGKAYDQCQNTHQALLAKDPAAKGKVEFEVWPDAESFQKLKPENGGLKKAGGEMQYTMDTAGNLQYGPVGSPAPVLIDGAPVKVRN